MKITNFCTTKAGTPVFRYDFGDSGSRILMIGGVHGDEPEGVLAAKGVLQRCLEAFPFQLRLTIIPEFNTDGILKGTRGNCAGVDLNRNLPTKDWSPVATAPRYQPGAAAASEPETQALVSLLKNEEIKFIVSLHSWNPMLNVNGNCEPEASVLAKHTQYKIEPDIGYPTPGSLGTYTGHEMHIPTLTYEIQREIDFAEVHKVHVPALWDMLKASQTRN